MRKDKTRPRHSQQSTRKDEQNYNLTVPCQALHQQATNRTATTNRTPYPFQQPLLLTSRSPQMPVLPQAERASASMPPSLSISSILPSTSLLVVCLFVGWVGEGVVGGVEGG